MTTRAQVAWLAPALAWSALGVVAGFPLVADPEAPVRSRVWEAPWYSGAGVVVLALVALAVWILARGLSPPHSRRRLLASAALPLALLALYLVYTGNRRVFTSGDNQPTRLLAERLVTEGTFDLTPAVPLWGGEVPYWAVEVEGRLLSAFPLGTVLLVTPYWALGLTLADGEASEDLRSRWEKHAAALIMVAAGFLFFIAVRSRAPPGAAAGATLVFALATPVMSTASQGLWSFTGELLFLALALALMLPPGAPRFALAGAGAAMGAAFFCRPSAAALAALLGVLVWRERGKTGAVAFGAGLGVVMALAIAFHMALYGHPLGGYGLLNLGKGGGWLRSVSWEGLAGVLASPSRGLLWFFPAALLLPLGMRWLTREERSLWWASAAAVAVVVALAALHPNWWGGFSFGPRLLTESAPFLALLALPFWRRVPRKSLLFGAFAAALIFAAATQLQGIYRSQPMLWNLTANPDHFPHRLWSVRSSQLAATWRPGWNLDFEPYHRLREGVRARRGPWHHVDLGPAANARYDADPFTPGRRSGPNHFPRLHPQVANQPGYPFAFGPRGVPNAVTTCYQARPLPISLPEVTAGRLHAILTAGRTRGDEEEGALAATLLVRYLDGKEELFPLRLGREVFAYWAHLRQSPPTQHRLYAGSIIEPDALLVTTFWLSRTEVPLAEALLLPAPEGELGVTLLALTVEATPGVAAPARRAPPGPGPGGVAGARAGASGTGAR
jgi:hypothetical protein